MNEKKYNDTGYLMVSARVRALENYLLNSERMERMLDAKSDEDAIKVLGECGYELSELRDNSLEELLAQERAKVFSDLESGIPDKSVLDVFRIKYDYHNAKVVLKARATGESGERLLSQSGRIEAKKIVEALHQGNYVNLTSAMTAAVVQAADTLASTLDPQLADFILDKACFREMLQLAEDSGSSYLTGYVKILIDASNLRSAVRSMRMKKGPEFMKNVIIDGGNVRAESIIGAVMGSGSLEGLFVSMGMDEAVHLGEAAARGGRLTSFEKACDDAVTNYLKDARYAGFGLPVVIGFLAAKENELTAIRIIVSGKHAGLSADTIRERLREAYV